MAKKYCHKDSFTNTSGTGVVDEVRVRNGTNAAIPFNQIASTIQNLAIPVDRGSPSVALTANNSPYTIPKGKYTGGSVSVQAQSKTATLSANGSAVYPDSGRVLSSVTVPAKNTFSVSYGTITPTDKATSVSITGLSFQPKGVSIHVTRTNGIGVTDSRYLLSVFSIGNTVGGCVNGQSGYKGQVTGATVSFGSNSVSISNITATRNGSSVSPYFKNNEHAYFVWG